MSDTIERARELADKIGEKFLAHTLKRVWLTTFLEAALQRERDEAADRLCNKCPSTCGCPGRDVCPWRAAIRGPEPNGGEGEA